MDKVYLVGPPGSGKTSRLLARLAELLSSNVRPDRILVLLPQQAQARPFHALVAQARADALALAASAPAPRGHRASTSAAASAGEPDITTIYGLAQQHVSLFFPLIAERAGFTHPQHEPVMMNVEAAQYFLDQIVQPRSADFEDLKLFRPRLLGQILDGMNKAAVCGFGLDEIAARLSAAWTGDTQRLVSYRRVQEVAFAFRQYCLDHSLLDFSLQMQTFAQHLLNTPSYHDYIEARYRHALVDNVEENPPMMHDFLREVLKTCDTALLAEDDPGGYRIYLGADVESARSLRPLCDEVTPLAHSYTASPAAIAFGAALSARFPLAQAAPTQDLIGPVTPTDIQPRDALGAPPASTRYWTGMVDWVVQQVHERVLQGVRPRDIAVLAPYIEDVLRFELQERLRPLDIRVRTVRPSRPLYTQPLVRMLLTFARLAHAQWEQPVTAAELARALTMSIVSLDMVRAQLLAEATLRISARQLMPLDDAALWQRVGRGFYAPYRTLQQWLAGDATPFEETGTTSLAPAELPLDLFWERLFNDVLAAGSAVPGFGLHEDLEAALAVDKLVQSARSFRQVFERSEIGADELPLPQGDMPGTGGAFDIGLEYTRLLSEDIIAAQYAPEREPEVADDDAVLLVPVTTYLINNFRSRDQFWLDVNSPSWYERVYQPLTHPYVLSRRWRASQPWTDADEHRAAQALLAKGVRGLTYRCADKLFIVSSQLDISGQEEEGPLGRAIADFGLAVSDWRLEI